MLNKNKLLLKAVLLLLLSGTVYGQRQFAPGNEQHLSAPGFFEAHVLPALNSNIAFYVYRIPYNRFVFIKDGDIYKAGFRISVEVSDSTEKHITRQIDEKSFSVDKYGETNRNDSYYEGVISFKISRGKFKLFPEISDLNSSKVFKLPEIWIDYDSVQNKDFLSPVIVMQNQFKCGGTDYYKLANFNNSITFNEDSYSLILPSEDTTISSINVILINNRDTVFKSTVNNYFDAGIVPVECDGNILLQNLPAVKRTRNFMLNNFSGKLDEGALRIVISKDSGYSKPFKFNTDVKWFNKPFSLLNTEQAIKLLKYIEKPSLIDSLLSFSRKDYEKELNNYWEKYNKSSKGKYNPLMDEYYSRIDYAMKNFAALSVKNGAETDRGKVYIKYGMPKKIERASDTNGKMVEKWIYPESNLVFEFTDLLGAGNYTLKK